MKRLLWMGGFLSLFVGHAANAFPEWVKFHLDIRAENAETPMVSISEQPYDDNRSTVNNDASIHTSLTGQSTGIYEYKLNLKVESKMDPKASPCGSINYGQAPNNDISVTVNNQSQPQFIRLNYFDLVSCKSRKLVLSVYPSGHEPGSPTILPDGKISEDAKTDFENSTR